MAPETVEKAAGGGVRASGHGLEIGPSGLLDQTIFNGDVGAGLGRGVGLGRVDRRGR